MASYTGGAAEEYAVLINKPWPNHSTNAFSGFTITVTAGRGAIIIAVLALLVRVAGEALWTIVACALHQYRARAHPQTAFSRQLQIILRNSGTSLTSVLEIINTGRKWHNKIPQALRKTVMLALYPFFIFASFTAAGILVAKVAAPAYESNQVLLTPTACGLIEYTPGNTFFEWQSKASDDIRQSRAYADRCFGKLSGTQGCTTLPTQQLPYSVDDSASCPFTGLCVLGNNGAYRMDTGVLDSHVHFGVNAKMEDRVGVQIVSTCSVIADAQFLQIVERPYPQEAPSIPFVARASLGSVGSQNFTWEWTPVEQATQSIAYTIHPFIHIANDNFTWQPIPELRFDNADTTIAFVAANQVIYSNPVSDPMFSANGTYTITVTSNPTNKTYMRPDHYFTTVTCADQLRLCNSANDTCTALNGQTSTAFATTNLGLNPKQLATVERILYARWASNTFTVIAPQGPSAVSAYDEVYEIFSNPLPSNQWQIEVEQWYKTALANMQFRMAELPNQKWALSGQEDSPFYTPADKLTSPWANETREQCGQQLVRSTAQYQSCSMAGLLIVVIVSVILIVVSWSVELLVHPGWECCGRRQGRVEKSRLALAWEEDWKLRLLENAPKETRDYEYRSLNDRPPVSSADGRDI